MDVSEEAWDWDLGTCTAIGEVVIFVANADQLSALVSLSNYGRGTLDNVVVRSGAGCQSVGILAYHEAESDPQRGVIGLTDTAARRYTAATLGHDVLTFAVPYTRGILNWKITFREAFSRRKPGEGCWKTKESVHLFIWPSGHLKMFPLADHQMVRSPDDPIS